MPHMLSPTSIARQVKERALAIGFDDCGIARAETLAEDRGRLERWLAEGMHGEMAWMGRDPAERAEPGRLVPGARSVIALAFSYHAGELPAPPVDEKPDESWSIDKLRTNDPETASKPEKPGSLGRVARYAWGADYHRVLGLRLRELRQTLARLAPGCKARSFVDSSPLLERAFAHKAGLGFIGKNSLLIHRELGSFVFLAAIVTDLELPVDASGSGDCGQCRLCLDACPTGAFPEPYVLDARRCISYWTIEAGSEPEPELAARFGDWIFGCDVCQDVCPYNKSPVTGEGPSLLASRRGSGPWIDIDAFESMDDSSFRRRFKRTPLTRPGLARMTANARRVDARRVRRGG